jgi:hypothetical protein
VGERGNISTKKTWRTLRQPVPACIVKRFLHLHPFSRAGDLRVQLHTDLVGDHPLPERGLLGWPRAAGAGHIAIELRGRWRRRDRLFGHGERETRVAKRVCRGGRKRRNLLRVVEKGFLCGRGQENGVEGFWILARALIKLRERRDGSRGTGLEAS